MTVTINLEPLITETTINQTKSNWYTFKAVKAFTKDQLRHQIETLFKVTVLEIKTSVLKEGAKRSLKTRKSTSGQIWKKVVVKIKPDQKIEVFDIAGN